MAHPDAFLQPYVSSQLQWFYRDSYWWTIIGLAGNALFTARFALQWYLSEKHRKIVVPAIFWQLSFWGSIVQLLYGFHIDKLPVILGYIALPVLYGRNLFILKRSLSEPPPDLEEPESAFDDSSNQ